MYNEAKRRRLEFNSPQDLFDHCQSILDKLAENTIKVNNVDHLNLIDWWLVLRKNVVQMPDTEARTRDLYLLDMQIIRQLNQIMERLTS